MNDTLYFIVNPGVGTCFQGGEHLAVGTLFIPGFCQNKIIFIVGELGNNFFIHPVNLEIT
ncbi:hypothetical protein XSR1_80006 [Xenorhabdus szentirmaii DSM 16338]|uniref:Uncharacterized protein n=1 Tax=Xenorhabdus szentirmaii DSM 16338 TaxID=1427518 RepID=W1J7P4_9GAMM|nr:hypothetical protein XSR1_80006 [Xenorhabdus szentirmaii DSM 16338]